MRKQLIGGAFAALLAVSGAGVAQAQDWSGPYVGGFLGYSTNSDDGDESLVFDTNLDGSYGDTVNTALGADAFSPGSCGGAALGATPAAGCSGDHDVVELGGRLGYDWQFGSIVVGVLGEYGSSGVEDSVTSYSTTPAFYTMTRTLDSLAAARIRLGFATGSMLFYATGGYASGDIENTFTTSNRANSFPVQDEDERVDGYQLGGGVEWMAEDNLSIGLEYVFTSLDAGDHTVRAANSGTTPAANPFLLVNTAGTDIQRSNPDFEVHSVRLTAAYRF